MHIQTACYCMHLELILLFPQRCMHIYIDEFTYTYTHISLLYIYTYVCMYIYINVYTSMSIWNIYIYMHRSRLPSICGGPPRLILSQVRERAEEGRLAVSVATADEAFGRWG